MALNLPTKMDFSMGTTEQKMDMTLDDIIKETRKKAPRVPIKGGPYKKPYRPGQPGQRFGNPAVSRAAIQRSVAARSANLRQSKVAEARARNGAGNFAASRAAGKRAFQTPIVTRNGMWMKSDNARRNNFVRQRPLPAQRTTPFIAAAGKMKISVFNNGSKVGGQRFPAAPLRRQNGPNIQARYVQTEQQNTDRMDVDSSTNQLLNPKGRTLDSLFAAIKERRTTQPQVVQPFTSVGRGNGRGGRIGYQGLRRQGGM